MPNFKVILILFFGCLTQISVAQDFQNLLESEYADTANLSQFYVVTNNSIDQYLNQESFRDALNLVEKAITVSRKFDQTDRLRSYYLKASLIHFRLGNSTRSLAYLRMFELELESKTSNEFEKRRNIFFDELTRLYQKIEQDSIFNRQLREQQQKSNERENSLFLWLKIVLALLTVSVGGVIYLAFTNKKLWDNIRKSESSNHPIVFDQVNSKSEKTDPSTSSDQKLYKAWGQIIDDQTKKISDTSLGIEFKSSFFIEEGDDLSPSLLICKNVDTNSVLIGFFSIQSSHNSGNIHLIALLNSIQETLNSELGSTGMIMTLIDQNFSKYISQSQINSVPVFGGVFIINKSEKTISYTGAGIALFQINKKDINALKSESAPLGSSAFKNQYYTIREAELKSGDWIYIFSPGVFNQIGGKSNQPFGMEPFLNLLQSIVGDSEDNQQFMIRKVFREWKGSNPQTDVSSVLGIKLIG